MRRFGLIFILAVLAGAMARAHATEGGFVLLLPTDIYIAAGVASVALTVLLLIVVPDRLSALLFRPLRLWRLPRRGGHRITSLLSALLLIVLVLSGLYGSRDPLENPLPLTIWVIWWIALVVVQGLIWDHWRWINPWVGPGALLARLTGRRAPLRYPRRLGHAPAMAGFLAFAGYLLADPAPADPARLAGIVGAYWLAMLAGLTLFGPVWLIRAEAVTVMMRAYRRLAMLGRRDGRLALGLPGWQLTAPPLVPLGMGMFMLLLLGSGSFDGLNETYWWFARLGLNPLEFPGRSAVIAPTLAGLLLANAALVGVFVGATWAGLRIARSAVPLWRAIRVFAPAILPIALGYHIAHYLTVFLVDGQYVLSWLTDPLGRGADLLGLGHHHVTTGFLSTPATVRVIFLTQAGAVVLGHVLAILVAHELGLRLFGRRGRAVLSQAPLALFMVCYTFFGLWLLASPRGM